MPWLVSCVKTYSSVKAPSYSEKMLSPTRIDSADASAIAPISPTSSMKSLKAL